MQKILILDYPEMLKAEKQLSEAGAVAMQKLSEAMVAIARTFAAVWHSEEEIKEALSELKKIECQFRNRKNLNMIGRLRELSCIKSFVCANR